MEQKHIVLSALSVGVGVGVGIGLASGKTVSKWRGDASDGVNSETMEQELLRQVIDGRDSGVTFDQFPYYLSEQTRVLLTSAAYFHLKHAEASKYTRNLSPASRAILLSGPAEPYQQMLAKALAHYFEAKLLLLDATDFSLKIQSKYGANKESLFKRSNSETTLERLSGFFGSFSILPQKEEPMRSLHRQSSGVDIPSRGLDSSYNPRKLRRNSSAAANLSNEITRSTPTNSAPLKRTSSWSFDEKLLIQSLYKVLVHVSKTSPIVLYLRDVEKILFRSKRTYNLFQKMFNKLSGSVLILGSRVLDQSNDSREVDEGLAALFPYNIEIKPPGDETHLVSWKNKLEEDMKMIQVRDNRNHIMEVLSANDLDCDDLDSVCVADTMALSNYIEEIVVSAISYHLMNKHPEYRNGKLVVSSKSLSHGLSIFQESKSMGKDSMKVEAQPETSKEAGGNETVAVKPETKAEGVNPENESEVEKKASGVKAVGENSLPASKAPEVPPDNEFEKRIRPEVIPPNEINVTFSDIGALEETKESLQELVMLPLRRPDLFKGGLLKPCRGILLFGPPGTGKTMLAKAIAKEAGASFINVSMSTITSKWFGEDEKNVRALFTLAAKVSPTIIFVDEVDSMLGQRSRAGEHEAMRKIKNEFMTHWDGLLTHQGQRILVLAATNRPFDLDEAIIRRFERRIMVGLPSAENRERILKTLLGKEKMEGLDFKELATMTEGYSGSDLKNLCTTAAYRPVRELIQQERLKDLVKKQRAEAAQKLGEATDTKEVKKERVITLRPLNMEDFKLAKNQVAASFAAEGASMNELQQWNELYGEGGSRKKQQLTYFL
ncbi:PREDICTED: cell division control protein 48 homolog C-like [Populus euphratica]|uniref:Cell division control protein 48 homolog C-like n=1 Tax=Populus euphratica TaxID=75702 RepID=A0AAJ6UBN0_POPEU|nr:PREDICTED: cell division control protein 48 homolog C-like [Populus euphratica]